MSSGDTGNEQDQSLMDAVGPFITVVSVDGGLQSGNKLTVITPTEICETSKQGKQAVIRKLDTSHDKTCSSSSRGSKLTLPKNEFEKADDNNNGNRSVSSSSSNQRSKQSQETTTTTTGSSGAAYVTVLALTEGQSSHDIGKTKPKSGIPVRAEPASLSSKKSVVNICNNPTTAKGYSSSNLPAPSTTSHSENGASPPVAEDQVVTIGNKALVTKSKEIPHIHHVKNASIVEITMKECSSNAIRDALWENDIPTKVREHVVVYRLPGERLGFALKFDGGTVSASDKVNHLYIQSCAEGSPARRTATSWGHLREGDEIIEIEKELVSSMTRMDCVQALKDSSVAVQLLIEHTFSAEEIHMLKQQKRENAIKGREKLVQPTSTSGIPSIQMHTKESKFMGISMPKDAYKKSSHSESNQSTTGIFEKGIISNNPNQPVTNECEQKKSKELTSSSSALLSTKTDASEGKFDDDIVGTGRSHSRIPISRITKRGHATSSSSFPFEKSNQENDKSEPSECTSNNNENTKDDERLNELKLQPPVGFEDELHSQQQRIQDLSLGQNNYERNKSDSLSFVNDGHYKGNEENEKFKIADLNNAQDEGSSFTRNYMKSDSLLLNANHHGSSNGVSNSNQNLLSSNSSLSTSNSYVHLSGNENLSISTCCESDETESTRSTVVSRLSIGSSMTSISAVMAVPGCCTTTSDSNNNTVTLTQISECSNTTVLSSKRRSSPNSSLSNNSMMMCPEGLIAPVTTMHGGEEKSNRQQQYYHECETFQQHHEGDLHHHQQLGQQKQHRSVNNVTTIPYSSVPRGGSAVAEIPLEPPLSFQDKQELVSKRRRDEMQGFSNIISTNGTNPSFDSETYEDDSLAENSNDANDAAGLANNISLVQKQHLTREHAEFFTANSALSHHHHHEMIHKGINNHGFGSGGGGRKDGINNDSFSNESNFGRRVVATDRNNNEQELFDDDELALLADELGLDQEDEDLFKTMLAEVEAAELEEYGPVSATEGHLVNIDHQMNANNVLIDDFKEGKSYCERNQRETVVSAKLGTSNAAVSVSTNDNNDASVRIGLANAKNKDCVEPRNANEPLQHEESWTISNSSDNGDVRGLERITMTPSRRSGEASNLKMSEQVKSAKEFVRENNSFLMKQEASELYETTKTNDSFDPNVTGSSDNKELIDERCNGSFESSPSSSSSSDLHMKQQLHQHHQYPHESHQHTQHLQPPPARLLSYPKEACKQGNGCKNGTIILQNEKVVEPIMDKMCVERIQIALLTSQQETSVTSKSSNGDANAVVLNTRAKDTYHHQSCSTDSDIAFNKLDADDFTNTRKIVSSRITGDHTDCSNKISQVKLLSQESSRKTTLFVAGLPVSNMEQEIETSNRCQESSSLAKFMTNKGATCEEKPPYPARRLKGLDKRTPQSGSESRHILPGVTLSDQEVSKNYTTGAGTTLPNPSSEQAVENIKGNEKLVASHVHSATRHNSLKPGLSDVNCGGDSNAPPSTSTAEGINNAIVINNTDGIANTDRATNSRSVSSNSAQGLGLTSSESSSSASSAVSVTSSVVKNSSESSDFGPTRKNVDTTRPTGDDRINSCESCPQRNECISGTKLDSTLKHAGCSSICKSDPASKPRVAKQESSSSSTAKAFSYSTDNSQPETLLSLSQPSASSLASTLGPSVSTSSKEEGIDAPGKQAGSSAPDTLVPTPRTMDSSTEVLHQYIPPTFSRLPPDGDEFPNSWSDEQQSIKKFESRKVFRSEISLKEVELEGAPPPLPTTGPPVEDSSSVSAEDLNTSTFSPPPLPVSMPPLPPKPSASRQSSIDDKRKLFESSSPSISNKPPVQYRNSISGANMINTSPTTPRVGAAEPSKRSVKDKIAMFSSRTPSTEDAPDCAAKPPSGAVMITSSLKKSQLANNSTNSLSRSSDNILQGLSMTTSTISPIENGYKGINTLSKINRSSLDISALSSGGHSGNTVVRKSSVDLMNFNSKPAPFYGGVMNGSNEIRSSTLGRGSSNRYHHENGMSNGNSDAFVSGKVLCERSQSMIDVGGPIAGTPNNFRNSYHTESSIMVNQNGSGSGARYSNPTYNTIHSGRSTTHSAIAANSIMEQRRKCMTKLRGLVIPDVPPSDPVANISTNNSASVVDLPTIISKDAVILPQVVGSTRSSLSSGTSPKSLITRSESFDGLSSSDDNSSSHVSSASTVLSTTNSAKIRAGQTESLSDLPDWKLTTNALPKYSPAFKRRSLTAYQANTLSSSNKTILTAPQPYKAASQQSTASPSASPVTNNTTPEPKSLESLTSPRSDSSFEFSGSQGNCDNNSKQTTANSQPMPLKRNSIENQTQNASPPSSVEESEKEKAKPNNQTKGNYVKGGKLDDSDNDSAVSSSRSSISHGLSPPNSPTPEESSTTPDPDLGGESRGDDEMADKDGGSGDPSLTDESWRILKPQSVEAINRKNVLTSAKFSSGGVNANDDSSISSSNGKNRRSDDEEASYADAETEDTESSCSELEVSKTRRRMIVAGRINLSQRRNSKADTEEEDYEELEEAIPAHLKPIQLHSLQNAVDLGDDLVLPGLTESPLQAIYDMEVKMAYINEVCDALPGSGRSDSSSRYFSRRDSEATVIERPIEPKRKLSMDMIDSAAERRARNRSSSGNESDFSSSISQKSNMSSSRSSRDRETKPEVDRWSLLEKKYSRSMTAVNLVAAKATEPVALSTTLTPATSVPKIVTGASEIVEKKIEKIIEKTSVDGSPKKITNATIPRGRNDFKSLSEKWQQISGDGKPTSAPPPVGPKPCLSRQNSTSSSSSTATTTTTLKSRYDEPAPELPTSRIIESETITKEQSPTSRSRPTISPKPSITSSPVKSSTTSNVLEAIEADAAWAETRRNDNPKSATSRLVKSPNPENIPMSSAKRSVSVNDIRKAFEKAETAVSAYGREDNSQSVKKDATALTLPSTSAHFRVSSFDSTTSEESSATTPAGIYGSVNSLVSSAPRDPYGSITSLASSTSLISPQELQQLIDEANQSLEEAGTPSHEVAVVILHREFVGGSLGITLAGGADYETKEITVHKVISGSIADRDARVHRGDRILSINGKSTKGLTHREALNLLKAPRTEVVLVVSRGRTSSNGFKTIDETTITLDRAVEPLLNGSLSSLLEADDDTTYKWGLLRTVALTKDGAGLGFSLEGGKGSINGDRPLTVKKIFIGGPAEKCGEMKVGDLIVSINGVNMSTKSRTEAWNFMKKLGDGEVKIAVRSPMA
ncbi:unnamed protein product [Orchesella dallaii]|uniref:PDZ domain-containing protein n=1 Tax=Orchesella dallaii TaxID=48710 RepID=A0ABP1RBP8_9HEXA